MNPLLWFLPSFSGGGEEAPVFEPGDRLTQGQVWPRFGVVEEPDEVVTWFDVTDFGATGDGVTDDAAAIQEAIDEAEAIVGGGVYLPVGTYMVGTTLLLPDNVTMEGDGYSSVIKRLAGASIWLVGNADRTTTGNENIVVRNLRLHGNRVDETNVPAGWCLYFSLVTNCRVENVWAHEGSSDGLVLEFAQQCTYINNHVWNCNKPGIYFAASDHCNAYNNFVWDLANSTNIGIALACSWYCAIVGNNAWNCPNGGINLGRDSRFNIIAGNNVSGIGTENEEIPSTYADYLALASVNRPNAGVADDGFSYGASDNLFVGNTSQNVVGVPGVSLRNSHRNRFIGLTVAECEVIGIRLQGAKNNSFRGGSVMNVGKALTAGNRWAFHAETLSGVTCDAPILENFDVLDTQGSPTTQGFNFVDGAAARGKCRFNTLGSNITSPFSGSTPMEREGNTFTAGAAKGTAVLVNGTVTVSTAEVLAGDTIRLTRIVGAGTTRGLLSVGTIVAGTSFVIRAEDLAGSLSADDDSTIFWEIVH